MEYVFFENKNEITNHQIQNWVDFLHEHLGEFGDAKEDIQLAIEYALQISASPGGFVFEVRDNSELLGVAVLNKTGMKKYIPANILVYISVHHSTRGKGIGKEMMQRIIEKCKDGIALHVEPNNEALKLYEKVGFTNKYLEMRYTHK